MNYLELLLVTGKKCLIKTGLKRSIEFNLPAKTEKCILHAHTFIHLLALSFIPL